MALGRAANSGPRASRKSSTNSRLVRGVGQEQHDHIRASVATSIAHSTNELLHVADTRFGLYPDALLAYAQQQVPGTKVAERREWRLGKHNDRFRQLCANACDQRLMSPVPDGLAGRVKRNAQLKSYECRDG